MTVKHPEGATRDFARLEIIGNKGQYDKLLDTKFLIDTKEVSIQRDGFSAQFVLLEVA